MAQVTTAPAGYRIVEIPESRKDEFQQVDQLAFAFEPDAETAAQVPLTLDWSRTMALETQDGTLAAVHASFPFTLPVLRAEVPCAGLTSVGARPDHRRRGLLSAMIDTHFARAVERSEPVSALFAAEPAIYGRFGYGSAADNVRLVIPRGAALRDTAGSDELTIRFEPLDRAVHVPLVQAVHAAAGRGRPGWIRRDTSLLQERQLADPPAWREGGEPFSVIMTAVAALAPGQPLRLLATFKPLPLFQVLGARGFDAAAREIGGGDWEVIFTPADGPSARDSSPSSSRSRCR